MKFNSLLLLGVILSCTGLTICVFYIPESAPSVNNHGLSDPSMFLETPITLPQQHSYTEFNYSALINALTNLNITEDNTSNTFTSYEQSVHIDKTRFITVQEPAITTTLSMILNHSMNPDDFNEIWNDLSIIYAWVQSNIRYQNDTLPLSDYGPDDIPTLPIDHWQYPAQTLLLGQGDCEDQALLLTTLLRNYYNEAFYIECLLLQSTTGIGHITTYLPVKDDALTIIDPATGYSTATDSHTNTLTSRTVEQEITNYLAFLTTQSRGQWQIVGAFSSYFDRTFSSNDAFSNWLLSRMTS